MASNSFKVKNKRGQGTSLFARIERWVKLDDLFLDGLPIKHLPKILFLVMICIFYIGNTHYAEKTIRQVDKLQVEVEDMRADFITLKADLMFASKQSEVARKVKKIGLEESLEPPVTILLKDN